MPMPTYTVGESVTWTGSNPDVLAGTGYGPSYLIKNPGTVVSITGGTTIVWDDDVSISFFSSTDTHLENTEPTPP